MDRQAFITSLERQWATDHRWDGIRRPYGAGDVYHLRGSIDIEYSLARHGAARLWQLLQQDNYLAVLTAITGNQAIQEVRSEEHTSELQSQSNLVCRLLLEKKKKKN